MAALLILGVSTLRSFVRKRDDITYVQWANNGTADAGAGRTVHLAANLLTDEDVLTLRDVLQSFTPDSTHLDSTDGLPAYETYLWHEGKPSHAAAPSIMPALQARMADFTQSTYSCPSCFVCSVLLRRYRADERLRVPSHFDRLAFVTAVASLNPADFEGGLYLQRTANAASREYFWMESGRDVVFHQYDLNHGVDVLNGTRFSAVFWITDTAASCENDESPWYRAPAEAGSADAQDALGELHQLGQHGYNRDPQLAAYWATKAAEQGHAMAQSRLGRLLLSGAEGVPRDKDLGMKWVHAAADQGYAPAQHTLGVACQYGDEPGGAEGAVRWFRRAAEVGVASSQYELGVAYVNGDGVESDLREGIEWLWLAMRQGHKEAKADLRTLSEAGVFEWTEEMEAAAEAVDAKEGEEGRGGGGGEGGSASAGRGGDEGRAAEHEHGAGAGGAASGAQDGGADSRSSSGPKDEM